MASRHVTTELPGIQGTGLANDATFAASLWDGDRTVEIPKWLMVLAARGEVTLRVAVDLEDDPLSEDDDIGRRR
jgi:hypothetical protein